jgi:hypothetical protein
MVDLSNFADLILPLVVEQMATAVTDSLKYHLNTAKGHSGLHDLHSSRKTAGIDATDFPTEAALTTDGPDGVGAIAMGNEANTRKVVVSLTSLHVRHTPPKSNYTLDSRPHKPTVSPY